MSGLARWFAANGRAVAGYDRTPTPLTRALEAEGVAVHYTDEVALIPADFLAHPAQTLVVYTPAVPRTHTELQYLQQQGFTVQKRSQVLGLISRGMRCIAVAGTHGKTSTSALVAHLLRHAGVDCAAFLGGISVNYQTNLLLNQHTGPETWVVVEADEYDRSFLTLHPEIAVITHTDADHLDIYGDHASMLTGFAQFAGQVRPGGHLFLQKHQQLSGLQLAAGVKFQTYGVSQIADKEEVMPDIAGTDVRVEPPHFAFKVNLPNGQTVAGKLAVPGFHNVENAVAAVAVAQQVGLSTSLIAEGLATFRGVKRRFEYVVQRPEVVYIDDYAHHPTEISAFLRSVRALYPGRHLTVVFQPHLFTRTRDFAEGFSESLSLADRVLLLPIYPARELPLPSVTAEMLLPAITLADKHLVPAEQLMSTLAQWPLQVLVTVGAGDIDRFVPQIKQWLEPANDGINQRSI
ncbi:MAG: UDP-N-acetylmuramate--L-alanine ligase [Bernardetiaceae bacterium]|nr:UDP-N-acetylmuramate--L-alanine ligase [Bernardetiaceae bacterium]